MVSVITAYSQQGGGGAHDEDYLGYIVVYGDRVEEDDIETDAGAHYGIVDTIDQIHEAVAPSSTAEEGEPFFAYDTRDQAGDPVGTRPEDFTANRWFGTNVVELASSLPDNTEAPEIIEYETGGTFNGFYADRIEHGRDLALREGTFAFSFTAEDPKRGANQALLSKDYSGNEDGGHLGIWIDGGGRVVVRFQGKKNEVVLRSDTRAEAGEEMHVTFSFEADEIRLYINGELEAIGKGYPRGMYDNKNDLVLGASTAYANKWGENPTWFYQGEISNLVVLDRAAAHVEAMLLSQADNDPEALTGLYPGTVFDPIEITGSNAADRITGTNRVEEISAMSGNDTVLAKGGDDTVVAGKGHDLVLGHEGDDTISGNRGNDTLHGGEDNDTIDGGANNDLVNGQDGDDMLFGGPEMTGSKVVAGRITLMAVAGATHCAAGPMKTPSRSAMRAVPTPTPSRTSCRVRT